MLQRVLETEVMDTWEDALEYDAMDFTEVNTAFALRAKELGPPSGMVLDCGTGTARIPILIAHQNPNVRIVAIDLSLNMLKKGNANVADAGLTGAISVRRVDAKSLTFSNASYDMLISNSLIHHLPDPLSFLKEINRVIKPYSGVLIRDLIRPDNLGIVDQLVKKYAGDCNDRQQKLYRDSLHAAFTLKEAAEFLAASGIEGATVVQSSDRHWSIERRWSNFSRWKDHGSA